LEIPEFVRRRRFLSRSNEAQILCNALFEKSIEQTRDGKIVCPNWIFTAICNAFTNRRTPLSKRFRVRGSAEE